MGELWGWALCPRSRGAQDLVEPWGEVPRPRGVVGLGLRKLWGQAPCPWTRGSCEALAVGKP